MHEYISKIKSLQSEIEIALDKSDFERLANLSTELENSVKTLTSDSYYQNSITPQELNDLKNLLLSVDNYQQEASVKFKNYTSEVSRKQKMHQAYR